jgi:hypothetical protein
MNARLASIALFNIGGGEIILILVLLFVLALLAVAAFGLIYLIVRAAQNRPARVVSTLPPEVIIQNQQKRDLEHVRLLSIFHFVFAGLALLGIAFLGLHYFMMHTIFSNPDMWKSPKGGEPPPQAFLNAFIWFYIFGSVVLLAGLVLNVLSAFFLLQKRHWLFSLIIGGLNCLQIPFGTALGIFTIIVLCRDSVRELYSSAA